MGHERKSNDEREAHASAPEEAVESRRHRRASEARFGGSVAPRTELSDGTDGGRDEERAPSDVRTALDVEARSAVWSVVVAFLFTRPEYPRRAVRGGAGDLDRTALLRVWSAPPLLGDLALFPADVRDVFEGWTMRATPHDLFSFLESVHDNLYVTVQEDFTQAVNLALARGGADHRFVLRRLVPFSDDADVAAVERAVSACKAARQTAAATRFFSAITRLSKKPQPDLQGAVDEAVESTLLATADGPRARAGASSSEHPTPRFAGAPCVDRFDPSEHEVTKTRVTTSDEARTVILRCAHLLLRLASSDG